MSHAIHVIALYRVCNSTSFRLTFYLSLDSYLMAFWVPLSVSVNV